ncbi:MAG: universal stress protein [Nitrososphaerales archaeon]
MLVAIDGSSGSKRAVDHSVQVARATGWELVLLHVLEEEEVAREFMGKVKMQRLAEPEARSYLQMKLRSIIKKSAPEIWISGIKYSTVIEVGDAKEKIVTIGRRMGVELIVLGFEGLNGVQRVRALGSLSRALIEKSKVPILVVPQEAAPVSTLMPEESIPA